MELTVTSRRSSWDRSARSTRNTCLKSLPSSTSADFISFPSGTSTGSTTYPTVLPGAVRITRPTAWTMSMSDRLGAKNATASSAGTSTPSVRQRALDSSRARGPSDGSDEGSASVDRSLPSLVERW